jgi:hypothetical protein
MNELKNIARARVAENIASMIGVPSEMQAVLFKNSSFVERDVVADKDSPLWFGLLRARCLSILRSGTAAVQESAYYLLNSREVQMNLTDSEVLLAMWDAATHGPLNPRFAGELKKVAQWLKAKTGTEVEMPKSWDRLVVGS